MRDPSSRATQPPYIGEPQIPERSSHVDDAPAPLFLTTVRASSRCQCHCILVQYFRTSPVKYLVHRPWTGAVGPAAVQQIQRHHQSVQTRDRLLSISPSRSDHTPVINISAGSCFVVYTYRSVHANDDNHDDASCGDEVGKVAVNQPLDESTVDQLRPIKSAHYIHEGKVGSAGDVHQCSWS